VLIVLERTGRAIRKPAGDAMLSHAASRMGQGWGFGLREAMDQTGAVLGPLLMALVLARHAGYHTAFALLAIPAALALVVLVAAQRQYPHPEHLEIKRAPALEPEGIPRVFWIYLATGALIAAGTVDFPLAAYRFARVHVVTAPDIPLLYALAMLSAAVAAPLIGRLYDRLGLGVLAGAALVPAAATPLLFLGAAPLVPAGAALWGIGMSVQDATVRAAIADLVPSNRRASAYGYFDSVFGVAWFAGSALMGALYGVSPAALVAFSVGSQVIAAGVILWLGTLRAGARG
jgi:MFS family permease